MTDATAALDENELFRKIGRNLLLFQQAELLIKRLVVLDTMSFHSGESCDSFEQRGSIYQNMTMGQIAALFLERLCGNNPPASPPDDNGHSGVSLRFSIRLGDGLQLEERRESIAAIIEQRNEFVHHLFPKFASAGPGSHKPLAEELDARCIQIREEDSFRHVKMAQRRTIMAERFSAQCTEQAPRLGQSFRTASHFIPGTTARIPHPASNDPRRVAGVEQCHGFYDITLAARLRSFIAERGLEGRVNVHHFHEWCGEQLRN